MPQTTTAEATLTITPTVTQAWSVTATLYVYGVSAVVTATISWTDPNSGPQSTVMLRNKTLAVGMTALPVPRLAGAASGDVITIDATTTTTGADLGLSADWG